MGLIFWFSSLPHVPGPELFSAQDKLAHFFAMLVVIGCPPNAITYSCRYFQTSDITKSGLVATPVLLSIMKSTYFSDI